MRNEIELHEDLFMPTDIIRLEDISFSMKAILSLIIQVIEKKEKFNFIDYAFRCCTSYNFVVHNFRDNSTEEQWGNKYKTFK